MGCVGNMSNGHTIVMYRKPIGRCARTASTCLRYRWRILSSGSSSALVAASSDVSLADLQSNVPENEGDCFPSGAGSISATYEEHFNDFISTSFMYAMSHTILEGSSGAGTRLRLR
eukprot:3397414-Amphidinium_carterae.1